MIDERLTELDGASKRRDSSRNLRRTLKNHILGDRLFYFIMIVLICVHRYEQ